MISCHFIGYPARSKGFRFYCPNYGTRIVETGCAKFIEHEENATGNEDFNFEEEGDVVVIENAEPDITPLIPLIPLSETVLENPQFEEPVEPQEQAVQNPELDNPQDSVQPRRSDRPRRSTATSDYVYLQEADFDIGDEADPTSFKEAMESPNADEWREAMLNELESMKNNQVWELVEPHKTQKLVGSKWVFKTKKDKDGRIERFKARLVAKGFTQREGIDYTETFSPVSTKDSFRIIMALVVHYDLLLHQIDDKTAFLNGELEEENYMRQPEGFAKEGKEHMVCKLGKAIYGLKQASRRWYFKFHQTVSSYGFEENIADQCIYLKKCGSRFIFLVLYVDDILLATNDHNLLKDTKELLSNNFEMKDLGEAAFVLGIEIQRDRARGLLGLSQKTYIERVLKRFDMSMCSGQKVPLAKGDLKKEHCPKNKEEEDEMRNKPYASLVGSIMYAQVCTRPDLALCISKMGRFQSNPGMQHWIAGKKILRYLQRTKAYMLIYRRTENLELVGYADANLGKAEDDYISTSGFLFKMAGAAVAWKSAKQTGVSSSTMFSEYIACYEATSHAVWLRNFIKDIKVVDSISRPIQIYNDNTAAVFHCMNNKMSSGLQHIDRKYLIVREKVADKLVRFDHIRTQDMIADPFTKFLPSEAFLRHVESMGLFPSFDAAI